MHAFLLSANPSIHDFAPFINICTFEWINLSYSSPPGPKPHVTRFNSKLSGFKKLNWRFWVWQSVSSASRRLQSPLGDLRRDGCGLSRTKSCWSRGCDTRKPANEDQTWVQIGFARFGQQTQKMLSLETEGRNSFISLTSAAVLAFLLEAVAHTHSVLHVCPEC